VPCEEPKVLEFFEMYHQIYLFIGNSPGRQNGSTSIPSNILKYNLNDQKFLGHQRIVSESVVDAKYFYLDNQPMRQHFLALASNGEDPTLMFYKFVDKLFVPIQVLLTEPINSLLPISQSPGKTEFFMLISFQHQATQIYKHNGWKFLESSVDFTGDAFGEGVASMRASHQVINNQVTIVLANSELSGNRSNIYTPILAKRNEASKYQESLGNWCREEMRKVQEIQVEKIDDHLKKSLSLVDTSEEANFGGKLFIGNSKIQEIDTMQLKSSILTINNQTVRKAIELKDRLAEMNEKLLDLNNKLSILRLQGGQRQKRQADPIVFGDLVIDESIAVERINGHSLNTLVYQDNVKNQFGIQEIEADEIVVKKTLAADQIDGIKFSRDNLILDGEKQVFPGNYPLKKASINQLSTQKINGLTSEEFLSKISTKFAKKVPEKLKQLECESIDIKKLLNNVDFRKRIQHSLRTNEDQVISGETKIDRLKVKQVIFQGPAELSGTNIENLVSISNHGEKQEIFQDVKFGQELLEVNQLFVMDRINNVQFVGGVAQVLRKNYHEMQVVTGEKIFDEILLFGPINLQVIF
jgi:hypothetical protein